MALLFPFPGGLPYDYNIYKTFSMEVSKVEEKTNIIKFLN